MSSYDNLKDCWHDYQSATVAVPYERDRVQGKGMRFAAEFNRLKDDICHDFGISPDEFNYTYKYEVMKKVLDG